MIPILLLDALRLELNNMIGAKPLCSGKKYKRYLIYRVDSGRKSLS